MTEFSTPIGGFFELELPKTEGRYHSNAISLSSGRSCIRAILQREKPRKVYVPYFSCDAVASPIHDVGVPFEFVAIGEDFDVKNVPTVCRDEMLLVINYFGLMHASVSRLAACFGDRLIVDDTQSFFSRGYTNSWSFNSARKFFGVPDGASLYSPRGVEMEQPSARNSIGWDHLLNRFLGKQDVAYMQYVANEASFTSEVEGMSLVTERLLGLVDYDDVAARRRRNFQFLDGILRGYNKCRLTLGDESVPFCYPFLPRGRIERKELYAKQIFFPTLWPECLNREMPGFSFERDVAHRLLPLPIDHRYGESEMTRIGAEVLKMLEKGNDLT